MGFSKQPLFAPEATFTNTSRMPYLWCADLPWPGHNFILHPSVVDDVEVEDELLPPMDTKSEA